jgi:hypothetical protein
MKSPDLVVVEWVDAYHLDGWRFGEPTKATFDPCWTVGFLVDKTKDGVAIAQTWYEDDMANIISIPKGMIRRLTVIGDLSFGVPETKRQDT